MGDIKEGKCENCNTSVGYLKVKTQEWQCRNCGHITKMKKEEEKING